jgi:hypothetical protein
MTGCVLDARINDVECRNPDDAKQLAIKEQVRRVAADL